MHNFYYPRILERAPNEILNFFASCFKFIRGMILCFSSALGGASTATFFKVIQVVSRNVST